MLVRFTHFTLLAALPGLLLPAAALRAQSAPAPAPSPVLAAPEEKPAPPSAPKRNRAISSGVAAALAAASPKYTPPAPKPPPTPEAEKPDMRDVDKPANTIVRLPKYIVQEKKPVIFSERAIHTTKGLTEIAMKRYLTETDRVLNRFRIPILTMTNEERALAMYAEDERLKNMSDLHDTAVAAGMSDPSMGTYIKKESEKTYLRSSDFGWSNSAKK